MNYRIEAWGASLVPIVILLVLVVGLHVPARAQVTVTIPDVTGAPGETVIVPLALTDIEGEAPVYAVQFEITYTPTFLYADTVLIDSLTLLGDDWTFEVNLNEGWIACALSGADSISDEGVLVRISFVIADTAVPDDFSPLHFDSLVMNEGNPAAVPVDGSITVTTVGVRDQGAAGDLYGFSLNQNYPNPFNPETVIKYALPKADEVLLAIYNLRGEVIARLLKGQQPAGHHEVAWDASNVASGIYFYRLQAGDFVETRKMVLLR